MMGVGAFAGLVSAILIASLMGASFGLWLLLLLVGPILGAVMIGMVS